MAAESDEGRTANLLHAAGWVPGRRVDVDGFRTGLQAQGQDLHPAAAAFLMSYGSLRLTPSPYAVFHFDPLEALRNRVPAWVKDYGRRVGSPLCTIGEAGSGHLILAMSPEGKVYAGFDEELFLIGDSPERALEALVHEREARRVDIP